MKELLIYILNKIHEILVLFILLGWLLPKQYLIYYIITYPLVLLHWKSNNGNCILTDWWIKLEGKDFRKDSKYPFMTSMFKKNGINLNDKLMKNIVNYGYSISWIFGMLRYFDIIKI